MWGYGYLESLPRKKRIVLLFLISFLGAILLWIALSLSSPALKVSLLFGHSFLQSFLELVFDPLRIAIGLAASFVLALFVDSAVSGVKERKEKRIPLLAEKESLILGAIIITLPFIIFIMFSLIFGKMEFSAEFIVFTAIMILVGVLYIVGRKFFSAWTKV